MQSLGIQRHAKRFFSIVPARAGTNEDGVLIVQFRHKRRVEIFPHRGDPHPLSGVSVALGRVFAPDVQTVLWAGQMDPSPGGTAQIRRRQWR
jgi:hypothetical protein